MNINSIINILIISTLCQIIDSTNNIIIENLNDTQEWWVALRILNVDLSCGGSIINVEITDNNEYRDKWIGPDPDGLQYDQYWFNNVDGKAFSLPISVSITYNYNNTNITMIAHEVIANFDHKSRFNSIINFCQESQENASIDITTTQSQNDLFKNILIKNQKDSKEWWVAFDILDEDLSCGGGISNVEISDSNNYKDVWIPYTEQLPSGHYAFDPLQNKPFTIPISVKITKHYNQTNEIIQSDNVINNFEVEAEFDFGSNFCGNDSKVMEGLTMEPTPSPTPSSTLNIVDNMDNIKITNGDGINEWWISFYISDIDESCNNGSIVNVEISDNKWYQNKWIKYDRIEYSYYVFETPDNGNQYTVPLSIKITREYEGIYDVVIGDDVIKEFSPGFEYDFGDNFCDEISVNMQDDAEGIWAMFTNIDHKYYYGTTSICLVFMIIAICACLDAKCFRVNDYYRLMALPSILLPILDMVSDIYFVVNVWDYIDWRNIFDINLESKQFVFVLIFVLSISFIIIPVIFSLFQLYWASSKYWVYNNRLSEWLLTYSKLLYFTSVLTGSSFNAIDIFNSNMFGLDVFYMGLPNQYLMSFATKRIYSVILLENIPQSVLSSIFLSMTGISLIPLVSISFSFISIVVTISSMVLQKRIYKRYDYVYITIDIIGDGIMDNTKCKQKMKYIKEYLCRYVLGINEKSVQIMKPYHGSIRNGIQLQIHICMVHDNAEMSPTANYENLLYIAIENESLQDIIKNEWKLSSIPRLENVCCEFIKSKEKKRLSLEKKAKNDEETKQLQEDNTQIRQRTIEMMEGIQLSI